MSISEIIIYSVIGIIVLFAVNFFIVLLEDALEWRKLKKKWKEDAEKRKGQYETTNLNIDPKQEPKKNLSNKNITKNSDKCNEKKLVPVAG